MQDEVQGGCHYPAHPAANCSVDCLRGLDGGRRWLSGADEKPFFRLARNRLIFDQIADYPAVVVLGNGCFDFLQYLGEQVFWIIA